MALNSATLKASIIAKVTAKIGADNLEESELAKFAEAIAEAVVEHVNAAAVVNVTTACGAGAGTGVGTVA
ncbi:MAG: hypothetical protein WD825_17390 [Gemmatimonadaceae bacterium]